MGSLVPAALRAGARRLFWSWPGGQPPADDAAAAAVLLAEGGRREWAQIDMRGLADRAADLPLSESLRAVWALYAQEEVAMAEGRGRVMDDEQVRILRVAAGCLPNHGFELAGGTALAAAYLGHRRSDDLDLFTGEPAIDSGLTALRRALDAAGLAVHAEPH